MILGTTILAGRSSLSGWTNLDGRSSCLRDVIGSSMSPPEAFGFGIVVRRG